MYAPDEFYSQRKSSKIPMESGTILINWSLISHPWVKMCLIPKAFRKDLCGALSNFRGLEIFIFDSCLLFCT